MTTRGLGRLLALSTTLLALSATLVAVPASARPAARHLAAAESKITLTGQPAWSTLGDDIPFRLRLDVGAGDGIEVRAIVYPAVLSRIEFERTLDGDRLGRDVNARSLPVTVLPVVGADRLFTLGLQDPTGPSDSDRIRLTIPGSGDSGVFPVKLQLRESESGRVLDDFVTDIVAVRKPAPDVVPAEPLQVAWLWNIAAPPGAPTIAPATASGPQAGSLPRARLGHLATALAAVGDLPITIVPNPATMDAVRTAGTADPRPVAALDAVRIASKSALVLSGPYPTIDGPSLMRAQLGPAYGGALTTGRETLESDLGVAVDRTIAPPQRLDDATLSELRDQGGTTRVVVDPEALTPAENADQFTPARPFRLDTAAGAFDALEVNRLASDLLRRPGTDALRAQQLLAGLAVVALEQPNRTRGVVINTPLLWDPAPARVAAVIAGLKGHPLLQGAALSDLYRIQPATVNRRPYARALAPIGGGTAPISARAYRSAQRNVDAAGSMIGPDRPVIGRLRTQLLLALAGRVPHTGVAVSEARLSLIDRTVRAITASITTRASRTVTLTSRRASVPLSIENHSRRSVRVRVSLASQKLDFPNGANQTVAVPPGNRTIQFDVEVRTSGTFPVIATVSSPDGRLDLQRARYTVRSSGVSGVGLVLTVGAGLFLAAWWLTHWRRSRRAPTRALAS